MNNNKKFSVSSSGKGKRRIIAAVALALALLCTVGGTLAYVFMSTDPVENVFQPSTVTTAVVEDGGTPVVGSNANTGTIKEKVQIKNTGDTDAYIRVAVVVNWADATGTRVWAQKPVACTHGANCTSDACEYRITYDLNNGWFLGSDGYYYYNKSVAPGALTNNLITVANQLKDAPKGADNTQYYLSIEIVASGIQSTPTSVVKDQWGVTVANDGTISK